jgi:hypothetical protein
MGSGGGGGGYCGGMGEVRPVLQISDWAATLDRVAIAVMALNNSSPRLPTKTELVDALDKAFRELSR